MGFSGNDPGDRLLEDAVNFSGIVLQRLTTIPGLVLGVVRNGKRYVRGFGRVGDGVEEPDGDTPMYVGSISKVFAGHVLASMVAGRTANFTDDLAAVLGWKLPEQCRRIRLIDLVTHTSGVPREIDLPYRNRTGVPPLDAAALEAQIEGTMRIWLENNPLLFAPGSGALYSNFGFNLLGLALARLGAKPHAALVAEHVISPCNLSSTTFDRSEVHAPMFQGHCLDADGIRTPIAQTWVSGVERGASGLISTANDLLRWMEWHLDHTAASVSAHDEETRLLNHAAYVQRDGLSPVYGVDESGGMDAMGLGWVVMMPAGNRPFFLQKAGASQGIFSYLAFAPTRGTAVFAAVNMLDMNAAMQTTAVANDLLAALAPR